MAQEILMKSKWAVPLVTFLLLSPTVATADFRTGNTWTATPSHAAYLLNRAAFWGYGMKSGNHDVTSAKCVGSYKALTIGAASDREFHRLQCSMRLSGGYAMTATYWQVSKAGFRLTDVSVKGNGNTHAIPKATRINLRQAALAAQSELIQAGAPAAVPDCTALTETTAVCTGAFSLPVDPYLCNFKVYVRKYADALDAIIATFGRTGCTP